VGLALRHLWPQTLLGLACVILLALTVPTAVPYALVIAGGPVVAVPLAVITASPAAGRALLRLGIGRLPEETAPPPEMTALALPAIALATRQRNA
jgi:membrane glycosyltransferase